MNFSRTISSLIEKGIRSIKVKVFGDLDVRTAKEFLPYGFDSSPIANMVAIFSDTDTNGKKAIIGYINKNQIANPGESRMYSTDANGVVKFYIYCKTDGTVELGGHADNAVRYSPLNTGLQSMKTGINAELLKIQTAIASLGGTYAKVDVSVDISASKINEVKTL